MSACDDAERVAVAVESVLEQTLLPAALVLVGPAPALELARAALPAAAAVAASSRITTVSR